MIKLIISSLDFLWPHTTETSLDPSLLQIYQAVKGSKSLEVQTFFLLQNLRKFLHLERLDPSQNLIVIGLIWIYVRYIILYNIYICICVSLLFPLSISPPKHTHTLSPSLPLLSLSIYILLSIPSYSPLSLTLSP